MRNDLVIQIDKRDHDETAKEDEQEDRSDTEPKSPCGQEKEQTGQGLDGRVAPGDPVAASAAPTLEQHEAEERDVVVPSNGAAADRTAGGGMDDALALGKAMDTDVQETTDHQANNNADDRFFGAHDPTDLAIDQSRARSEPALSSVEGPAPSCAEGGSP